MSTERYYTIDIVPAIARDLLVVYYFSPAVRNSPMFWGPPGVGKSTAVKLAQYDIARVMSYALTELMLRNMSNVEKKAALIILFSRSHPFIDRRSGEVYIFVTWKCSESKKALRVDNHCVAEWKQFLEELSEKDAYEIINEADTFTNSRVEELRDVFNELLIFVQNQSDALKPQVILKVLHERIGLKTYPLVVVNDDFSLIDYPCFIIHKESRDTKSVRCLLAKGDKCVRWSGNRCVHHSLEDNDAIAKIYDYLESTKMIAPRTYADFVEALKQTLHPDIALYGFYHHFVDVRLSQLELDDLKGIPSDVIARTLALEGKLEAAKGVRTLWLQPAWIVGRGVGAVFFDEINQAPSHIQGAAYMLILDRRVTTGYNIGKNVAVYAAGNPPSFAPEVAKELPTPLLDRLKPQFTMNYEIRFAPPELPTFISKDYPMLLPAESFKQYMREMRIREPMIDSYGSVIHSAIEIAKAQDVPKDERRTVTLTPRAVEFLLNMLGKTPLEILLLEYAVTTNRLSGFVSPITATLLTYYGSFGVSDAVRPVDERFIQTVLPSISVSLILDLLTTPATTVARELSEVARTLAFKMASLNRLIKIYVETVGLDVTKITKEYSNTINALLGSASPDLIDTIKTSLKALGVSECGQSAIDPTEFTRRVADIPADVLEQAREFLTTIQPLLLLFSDVFCYEERAERKGKGEVEYRKRIKRYK